MYSPRNSSQKINQLENIKKLAEEMAERKVQFDGDFIEEENFQKITLVNSVKHKSLMFDIRNKKKMLKYFSLNKINKKDTTNLYTQQLTQNQIIPKERKSTMDKKDLIKNNFKNKKKGFAIHSSLKDVKIDNEIIDLKEEYNDSYLQSLDANDNDNENVIEDINEQSENNKINMEKYNVEYVNPKEVELLYYEEKTPINTHKSKERLFFDKEMKLLKIKERKIEKKRKRREKRNKDFFKVVDYLNIKSKKMVNKNGNYESLKNKSVKEYHKYLTKIQMKQMQKNANKIIEEKKENEVTNNKVNKKIFNKYNWEEFIEKEYTWQNKKNKAIELLRDRIKNNTKYKPQINKNSEKIISKINRNNTSNYINGNNYNIFTRLYNVQEKYNNKLKMKRLESMPSFQPKLTYNKYKNNKNIRHSNDSDNISKYSNLENKKANQKDKQNSLNDIKKSQSSGIMTNKNINKKSSSLIAKSRNDRTKCQKIKNNNTEMLKNKSRNDKIKIQNIKNNTYCEQNKNNINIQNIINLKKNTINYRNIDKKQYGNDITLLETNNNTFKTMNYNKNINKSKIYNNDKKNTKIKDKKESNNNNNEKSLKDEGDVFVDLNNVIRNISHKQMNNKVDDETLYHLNIRDNTSNTIKENIVLTSKKYIDFFKSLK